MLQLQLAGLVAQAPGPGCWRTIGALIITYTIVGVPYCKYSIVGPKTLLEIMKAPILPKAHDHSYAITGPGARRGLNMKNPLPVEAQAKREDEATAQRAQYPLIKEYSFLNHNMKPLVI